MKTQVSVVIPVYNAEKTLERCVESIIYGEFQDISVILIDDCSKDNSWKYCQALANKYSNVFCYQNEKNRGVSYTRNYGLEVVESEYVLFIDSDDWVSGKYVKVLRDTAIKNTDALVIAGLHFRDEVAGERRDYIWEKNGKLVYEIAQDDFFELQKKFHLQQLWNKIFRHDIIKNKNLRFDESQSMGEDFQFVLEYMKAAEIQRCVVINQPLYYYIRWNESSLMSHFGAIGQNHEYDRLKKLLALCGTITPERIKDYEVALLNVKKNYIYQAVHGKYSKAELLIFIERIMQDGRTQQHYRSQIKVLRKEQICQKLSWLKKIPKRLSGYAQRKKRLRLVKKMKANLREKDFSIISQNCIGGIFYYDMEMQFTSPTIDLYLKGNDFVTFVSNLEYYCSLELKMTWGEEYPIGYLEDIAIYFMHYSTCQEAEAAWERRKTRINLEKILVLCTDMEEFTDEVYRRWKKIPYSKLLFTANRKYANESDSIFFSKYEKQGVVSDLIPRREFYTKGILLNKANNLISDEKK